jgi:septal ring factor EnvC (AmiA/AmiB activator)
MDNVAQDINNTSTEINRRQVQISTSGKTVEKLRKAIEDGSKDKEKLSQDKESKKDEFKSVEAKAFVIQENFTQLQQVLFWIPNSDIHAFCTGLDANVSLSLTNCHAVESL